MPSRDPLISSSTLLKQSLSNGSSPNLVPVSGPGQRATGAQIINLATKVGAIVAGQTSVKAPEREAFEKHLPQDVHIISCHSLHGPTVNPVGQPLVSILPYFAFDSVRLQILIKHRGTDEAVHTVESILKSFGSRYVYLSYEEHDIVTANTQAVTHAAFLRKV